MKIKKKFKYIKTIFFLVIIIQFPLMVFAQDKMGQQFNRDTLITTSRIMMAAARYCALITLDSRS